MLDRAAQFFRRIFARRSAEFDLTNYQAARWGGTTASRISVTEQSALKYSAVFACIRFYAQTVAAMPAEVFEINPRTGHRKRVLSHPVAALLDIHTGRPCPDMTAFTWMETRDGHLGSWGNSYTEITWGDRGQVLALTPRHSSLVTPYRDRDGALMYDLADNAGDLGPQAARSGDQRRARTIDASQMLHVPDIGGNGVIGWSRIRLAAETIGTGMGQERSAGTALGNGVKPSLVVKYPGKLDDEGFKRLEENLNTNYSGDQAHRAMLLDGGLDATPISLPLNDQQFLESREFSAEEICCRWYGLPPHVLGLMKKATFANVYEMDQFLEKYSIGPRLTKHEAELTTKLFTGREHGRFCVKFNTNALLRLNAKDRYEANKTGILSGQITINEAREEDDREPMPGCDVLLRPEAIFGKSGGDPNQQGQQSSSARSLLPQGEGGRRPDEGGAGSAIAATPVKRGTAPLPNPLPDGEREKSSHRNDPIEIDEDEDDDLGADAECTTTATIGERFAALLGQTLDGLLNREITAAHRAASKPLEFRKKIEAFYADHQAIVRDKLACLDTDLEPLLAECLKHRDELLAISERVTPADVRELTATWSFAHRVEPLLTAKSLPSQ